MSLGKWSKDGKKKPVKGAVKKTSRKPKKEKKRTRKEEGNGVVEPENVVAKSKKGDYSKFSMVRYELKCKNTKCKRKKSLVIGKRVGINEGHKQCPSCGGQMDVKGVKK